MAANFPSSEKARSRGRRLRLKMRPGQQKSFPFGIGCASKVVQLPKDKRRNAGVSRIGRDLGKNKKEN